MKIILCSVGHEDDPLLKNSIQDFTKRIGYYYPAEWKIITPIKKKTALPEKIVKVKEAAFVLESIKKDDFLVALDEKGTMLSSVKLASWLQARANESIKQLVFLIGGSYGLEETVLRRANFIWSFSPLTFPHQLMRLMLTEQLYRACTIIKNEKYHHA